jgi:hypothetical protein
MPLSRRSRYAKEPVFDAPGKDGQMHATVGIRRHVPAPRDVRLRTHTLTAVDTMETLAAKIYGSSAEWWRAADTALVRFPLDLVPGSQLQLPAAVDIGRVERSRRL